MTARHIFINKAVSNLNIFDIVGADFFKPLSGQNKELYYDCLCIIFRSYRTELSFGIDRDILITELTDYFDKNNDSDIISEDGEMIYDPRSKVAACLRNLKRCGWIDSEYSNDRREKIIMPSHSVAMMQMMEGLVKKNNTEYQSEISAIYSILINEELLAHPYPQIIMPVYEYTNRFFTDLKKLNTDIRKYIDELTDGQTPEEIMEHFFGYNEHIASKAYHRLHTNENVARYRNIIISRLNSILSDDEILKKCATGYQNIENCTDFEEAADNIRRIITDIINHFYSYDEIIDEIDKKHGRYLNSAVNRARLAFLSTNNMEGKLSTILRLLADDLNREEEYGPDDDASDDVCRIFNLFPQSFINGESLSTVPISRKIMNIEEIYTPKIMSDEEREEKRQKLLEKNKNRFSRKNINGFVDQLLKDRQSVNASEIEIRCKRDMMRIIFINLYGRDKRSEYVIIPIEKQISREGFSFRDFTIKRRVK